MSRCAGGTPRRRGGVGLRLCGRARRGVRWCIGRGVGSGEAGCAGWCVGRRVSGCIYGGIGVCSSGGVGGGAGGKRISQHAQSVEEQVRLSPPDYQVMIPRGQIEHYRVGSGVPPRRQYPQKLPLRIRRVPYVGGRRLPVNIDEQRAQEIRPVDGGRDHIVPRRGDREPIRSPASLGRVEGGDGLRDVSGSAGHHLEGWGDHPALCLPARSGQRCGRQGGRDRWRIARCQSGRAAGGVGGRVGGRGACGGGGGYRRAG